MKNSMTDQDKNAILEQRIKEVESRINAIQGATKTFFPQFIRVHNYLRNKFSWYEKWHLESRVAKINMAILVIYILTIIVFVLYSAL